MSKKINQANYGVAQFQFDKLNEEFYSGGQPAEYFDVRLRLLTLLYNEDPVVRQKVNEQAPGFPNTAEDVVTNEYTAVEVMNLFHQIVECLWRMILAFDGAPPCPQLALAQIGHDFGERLENCLKDPQPVRVERIKRVFDFDEVDGDLDMDDAADAIERLTTRAGHKLLADNQMYNSAKHGMSVSTSHAKWSFMTETEKESGFASDEEMAAHEELFSTAGMWIAHFDKKKRDGRWRWEVVNKAVDIKEMGVFATMCNQLIAALWQITKANYVTHDNPRVGLPKPEDVRTFLAHPERLVGVRRDLVYDGDTRMNMTMIFQFGTNENGEAIGIPEAESA